MRFRILIIIFAIIQIWFLYLALYHPIIGINVREVGQEIIIDRFDSQNIADQMGLQIGDRILQVNGIDANKYISVVKWKTVDQAKTILALHNGNKIEIHVRQFQNLTGYDVFSLIGESLSLFIAFLLYRKMPNLESSKYLSFVFTNIGFIFLSLVASIRGDALGKILIAILMMLLPVIFLHFLIVFLKEKGNIHLPSKWLNYLYSIIGLTTILVLMFFVKSEMTYKVFSFSRYFTLSFLIFGLILNFYILTFVYFKHRKEKSHSTTIIKTVWFSLFFSFTPVVCLSFIPLLLFGFEWISSFYMSWFVLIFPLTFAYLIITKQLYDIDLIVRRMLLSVVLAIVPSLVFTGMITLAFPLEDNMNRQLFLFFFFVLVQSFMLYSLEYVTTKLEAFLFPRKYSLNTAIKNISRKLGSISSFREIKEIVLTDIVNTLQVHGGAIVIRFQDSVETICEGEIDASEVERLVVSGAIDHPALTCLEINRHEEYTSFLVMTHKKSNTMLGKEELQWLNIIVSYLAVSLENVHLLRKLTVNLQHLAAQMPDEREAADIAWFRKLMFELQENERTRIASDLHDTTMQDLFFLKGKLTGLLRRYVFSKEDLTHMGSLIDYVDIINTNLRQSCFELNPYLLHEVGLVKTIEQVLEQESYECSFAIEFDAGQARAVEKRDLETKRHLFRMVQELINNAKKHSQASKVTIRLSEANNQFYMLYEDNGVGFDESEKIPAEERGTKGMGLEQMRSRVLHLKGKLEMESGKGKGLNIRIIIPLQNGMIA